MAQAPDTSAMKDHVFGNLKAAVQKANEPGADGKPKPNPDVPIQGPTHPAQGLLEAMDAGWQGSFSGLFSRSKMPDTVLPEDAPLAMQIASTVSGFVGDLPAMAAGMVAGGAVGTAELPVVGTVGGGIVGAFAVPPAMRKILIDHYQKGDITSAQDFAARAVGTAWEGLKGGVTGAAAAIGGGAATAAAGTIAGKIAEVAAMTSVAKGLEGQLPNWKDFATGAVVVGGFHAVGAAADRLPEIQSKLADIYKQTGARPEEVAEMVQSDPALKGKILSSNIEGQHIEVPSAQEQADKGLPQFTEKDLGVNAEKVESQINPRPDYSNIAQPEKLSDPEKEILSRIGEQKEVKEPFIDPDKIYNDSFDFLHNLKVAQDEVGGELSPEKNAYVLGRTFAAWTDKFRNFYEQSPYDFETQKPVEGGEKYALKGILDDAKAESDGNINKLNAFAMAKRAIELDARGLDQGFNIDTAKQVVAGNQKTMGPIQERLVKAGNYGLEYYRDAGMISDESFDRITKANVEHVPLKKILEPDPVTGKIPGSAKALKEIGDSDLDIKNPVVQKVQDIRWMIQQAEINRIKGAAIDHLLGEDGLGNDHIQYQETNNYRRQTGPTELDRMVDGKQVIYKVNPGLKDVFTRLEGQEGNLGMMAKLARPVTQIMKAGYMFDPGFAARHIFRAMTAGFTYSKTGQLPFVTPLSAIGEFMGKGEVYRQWLQDGGAQGSLEKINDRWVESEVLDLDKDTPFVKQAWNTMTSPFQYAHTFIALADNLTRLAEYKRSPGILNPEGSLNQNASMAERTQAAFNAREVTPDYSRIGAKMQAIQATTAFYNADLQGTDRMIRAFKDDPVATTLKSMAMFTMPGLLAWYATHDKDWYQGLPHWQKDLYTNLDVNNVPGLPGQAASYIAKIPQGFTQGLIFGSGPMRALDAYFDHDKTALPDFLKDVGEHVILGLPIPDVIKQGMQLSLNKSLFNHQPIIPDKMTKELPEMQYNEYTSDLAKALAKNVGPVPALGSMHFPGDSNRNITLGSPMVWDYLLKTGGPVGQFGVWLTDQALQKAKIAPEKPLDTPDHLPFAREFLSRYPNLNDQRVEDFLVRTEKSQDIMNSFQDAQKRGDMNEAVKLQKQYINTDPIMKGPVQFIHDRNAAIQNLQRLPMDPVQKRQLQDGMYFDRIRAATLGNKALDDLEKNRDANNK